MFLRALTAAPHSQQLLSPMTHTEDIQRVCQQGGHSARGPPTKPPLSPALGWHKGPRSGVSGKTAAPHTPFLILFLSFSLSFFSESAASNLLPLSPLPFLLLPLHPFPTPFFSPYRSSGPIVWTASSILSFSSGSLFRPSDTVSSSQRLMESQDVQTHTYFVLISSVFNRPHAQLQPCVCSREEGCTLTSTFLGLLYCRSAQQPARVLFV